MRPGSHHENQQSWWKIFKPPCICHGCHVRALDPHIWSLCHGCNVKAVDPHIWSLCHGCNVRAVDHHIWSLCHGCNVGAFVTLIMMSQLIIMSQRWFVDRDTCLTRVIIVTSSHHHHHQCDFITSSSLWHHQVYIKRRNCSQSTTSLIQSKYGIGDTDDETWVSSSVWHHHIIIISVTSSHSWFGMPKSGVWQTDRQTEGRKDLLVLNCNLRSQKSATGMFVVLKYSGQARPDITP